MKSYKEQVVESAIQGLIEGGFAKDYAYLFEKLLDSVYTAAYNEGKWSGQQESYINSLHWSNSR
jgi:hypothetical protein